MRFIHDKISDDFTFEIEEEKRNDFGIITFKKVRKSQEEMKKHDWYEEYRKRDPHPIPMISFMMKWNKMFPNSLFKKTGEKHANWIKFPPIEECKKVFKEMCGQEMFD